jgi:S-adenosyl methyltransferase
MLMAILHCVPDDDDPGGIAAGLELVEPGVVPVQEWRPGSVRDINSPPTAMWGLVARQG